MSDATIQWIVTSGSVLFAVATTVWAVYEGLRRRTIAQSWTQARRVMEATISRADILFQSDPDLTLIWADAPARRHEAHTSFPAPDHILGRGRALDLGGETGPSDGNDTAIDPADSTARFDRFLTTLDDESRTRFAQAVDQLRSDGSSFTLTLTGRHGHEVEASGRPAAAQTVVRLRDVSPERAEIERLSSLLREAEQDRAAFADMLDRAPVPMWRRRNHQLVWVNEAYAAAVDAETPDQAVAERRELEASERSMSAVAVRANEVQTKRRYVVIGGQRRAMDLIAVPAGEDAGGLAIDMSAVDDAEQQLERHIDAHKATLDKLSTGVAIFGADRRLVFFNDAYVQMWGLDRRWLETAPDDGEILDLLRERRRLPEQADFTSWKAERLAQYTEVADGDETWHRPDGRILRVVTRAHPFGGLTYLFEDVTDQISLESSYNTLINVQRVTLDHLREGVALFGSDGRMKLVNAAFTELFDIDPGALGGEPHIAHLTKVCDTKLAADQLQAGGAWRRIVARVTTVGGDEDDALGRLLFRDGRILEFATEALPDGRTLITFLDVTDTARIEQALRERNEALETADRLKSEFISNVSYQLRTPLNSIIGFAEMMDSGMVGDLTDRQKEYTGDILQASDQLRDLINDILDLAMIEAGTLSLDLGSVDIADLLDNARQVAVSRAADAELTVLVEHPKDIGMIVADERRLRQILFNLTSNAFHFTEPGGTVTIGAARTRGGIDLWVADTGTGIPADYKDQVFDRFASHGGKRRGAGLGLSLVKSFMELHGGGVTLESEPDKGTRVICHLPDNPMIAGQAAE